jgi:hypothetical protein
MAGKLYVVLDIDDTLQKFMKSEKAIAAAEAAGIEVLKVKPTDTKGFALRPHLREFMAYLFEHHYVSLWTWSGYDYATTFAKLVTDGHPERFKDILSAEDADMSSSLHEGVKGKNLHYLWYDFNEKYKDKNPRAVEHLAKRNANIKKINEGLEEKEEERLSPQPKKLFTGYAPCNTILIDDAGYNVNKANKLNLIKIKPFGGHTETKENRDAIPDLDAKDDELVKITEKLKELASTMNCVGDDDEEEKPIMKEGPFTTGGKRKTRKLRRVKKRHTIKTRRLVSFRR